ncbi:acyltransferase [Providencia sp. Me31A]|uniref:acyltransferase n=1 Tax=Providencia sp. Me31A TaxID=3392637 RepID=UPI003D2D5FE2
MKINKLFLKIEKIILRTLLHISPKFNSIDDYIRFRLYNLEKKLLKMNNVLIGKNTIIYNTKFSHSNKGDFFHIGDNCTITGATFIGHDASPTLFLKELVLKNNVYLKGSRKSYRKPIHVGNNVFIGVGTIILPGVNIGDNVIVAAGSVVSRNLEGNSVYAGNPAQKIKSIESYIDKYKTIYEHENENF